MDFQTQGFPTLNGEEDIFCSSCGKLRQLNEEQNIRNNTAEVVRAKIISTDKLLRLLDKKKKMEASAAKVIEELRNSNRKLSEQCTRYEADLGRLMQERTSLNEGYARLKKENEATSSAIVEWENKCSSQQGLIHQYETLLKQKAADDITAKSAISKRTLNAKQKEISKLREDNARLNMQLQSRKIEVRKLKSAYRKAVNDILCVVKQPDTSKLIRGDRLVKYYEMMSETLKRRGSAYLDDLEGSGDSEVDEGKKTEEILHRGTGESPTVKPPDSASESDELQHSLVSNGNISGHVTSDTEYSSVEMKDTRNVSANGYHVTLSEAEVLPFETNGVNNNNLERVCVSDAASSGTSNKQILSSDPSYCNNSVFSNGTMMEVCEDVPPNSKNQRVHFSVLESQSDISGSVKNGKIFNVCEASWNDKSDSLKSKNDAEVSGLFLGDFNDAFAEMKSQMCLKKDMLSPLSPLPPTPPPRSSSSPDVFSGRGVNGSFVSDGSYEMHKASRGQQGRFAVKSSRHENEKSVQLDSVRSPHSSGKNLLHQRSEGFNPALDDLMSSDANTPALNEFPQQPIAGQHRSSEGLGQSASRSSKESDKSFKAKILYNEMTRSFSLCVDPVNNDSVTIEAFESGAVNFNWQGMLRKGHRRSSSCVGRIQAPQTENKMAVKNYLKVECDDDDNLRLKHHRHVSRSFINQESGESSSFKRELFKEPELSSATPRKSENDNQFQVAVQEVSNSRSMPFAAQSVPHDVNKPFSAIDSSPSASFHSHSKQRTFLDGANPASKGKELPHRAKLKTQNLGKPVIAGKSDSTELSSSSKLESVHLSDWQKSLKTQKRANVSRMKFLKSNDTVCLGEPSFELSCSKTPKANNCDAQPLVQNSEFLEAVGKVRESEVTEQISSNVSQSKLQENGDKEKSVRQRDTTSHHEESGISLLHSALHGGDLTDNEDPELQNESVSTDKVSEDPDECMSSVEPVSLNFECSEYTTANNASDKTEVSPSQKGNLRSRRLSRSEQSEEHCTTGLELKSWRLSKSKRTEEQSPPIARSKLQRVGNLNCDEQAFIHPEELLETDVQYSKSSEGIGDVNDKKLQNMAAVHELTSPESLKSGEHVFSDEICNTDVVNPSLPVVDATEEVEALVLNNESYDLKTRFKQAGKTLAPVKAEDFPNSPHSEPLENKLQRKRLRSNKSKNTMSCTASGPRLRQRASNAEGQNSNVKKPRPGKRPSSTQSDCVPPDKPGSVGFIQARFQKIKSLSNLNDVMLPVKPKRNAKKLRSSLHDSEISCKGETNDKNSLLPRVRDFAISPECKDTVSDSSVSVPPVLMESKTENELTGIKEVPEKESGQFVVAGLNGVKQTLSAFSEVKVLSVHKANDINVNQNAIEENKRMKLENSLNFRDKNVVSPVLESTSQIPIPDVLKNEPKNGLAFEGCDISTRKMSNGHGELKAFDPVNGLNTSEKADGTDSIAEELLLNVNEVEISSELVSRQGKGIYDDFNLNGSGLSEKNESFCVSPKKKFMCNMEEEDQFVTSLEHDRYFQLAQRKLFYNSTLRDALVKLEGANEFKRSSRMVENMFISILTNPVLVSTCEEAAATIVHFLGSSQHDTLQFISEMSDINLPVMRLFEERLIDCLFDVQDRCIEHLKDLINALFSMCHSEIILNHSLSMYGVASLCRVFTELHRRRNCLIDPRILCHDILTAFQDTQSVPYILCAVVAVWPKVLDFESFFCGTYNPMCLAISRILYSMFSKYSNVCGKSAKIICHLAKLVPLQSLPSTSEELVQKIFEDLIQNDENGCLTDDHAANYTRAVELICSKEDWNWIHDIVVVRHIYAFLHQWIAKNRMLDHPVNSSAIKSVFNLIGSVCYFVPQDMSNSTVFFLSTLQAFLLDTKQEAPFVAQEAALNTLLRFKHLNLESILPTIVAWLEKNWNKISDDTRNVLETSSYVVMSNGES